MGAHLRRGNTEQRSSYPSGPRIDSNGNQVRTEYVYEQAPKLPNPDPANYKIVNGEQHGRFLVLKINYPDCTNYEGNKILVFENVTALDLLSQKLIDPHFFVNPKVASPVARFAPTDEGWKCAVRFAENEEKYAPTKKL